MISNIAHFNFGLRDDFGNKPFSLMHYLCVRSCLEINKPDQAIMSYTHEPDSPWWRALKGHLSFEKIKAPVEIYGRRLYHPAHQSDVLRLQKLIEHGGYYLDCDVLCVKPFADLLFGHKLVMGKQAKDGLCNAVMLSPPKDKFMRRWYDSYKTFRSTGSDQYWDEHSVRLPAKLARRYRWQLRILPARAFFYPLWGDMPAFMTEDRNFSSNSYTVHLWETFCWSLYENLTPKSILTSNSEFARLTKHLL